MHGNGPVSQAVDQQAASPVAPAPTPASACAAPAWVAAEPTLCSRRGVGQARDAVGIANAPPNPGAHHDRASAPPHDRQGGWGQL